MNTHGEATAVADAGAAGHGHDEHTHGEHLGGQPGELFEKSELDDFLADDRSAGEHIGILLAGVFLISFCLMSGVCYWMLGNASAGPDPQAGIGTAAESEHH